MDYNVKPCPFCGGVAFAAVGQRVDDNGKKDLTYSVICTGCHIGIFRPREQPDEWFAYKNAEDAVTAWNRRA